MIQLNIPEISLATVKALVADMNQTGSAVLPNYLDQFQLQKLREFVEVKVADAGEQSIVMVGAEAVEGTLLEELSSSSPFVYLLHRIYEQGCGKAAPDQSLYQTVRCLKGKSGLKHAFYFHYDSYVVTALLPIIIPTHWAAGDLIMAPNRRPVRSSYLYNLVDKIILDNPITQFFLREAAGAKLSQFFSLGAGLCEFTQIEMVPGNLYLFWGYRSVHANLPADPNQIRATALYHFGDPHIDSSLRRFTGRAKNRAKAI